MGYAIFIALLRDIFLRPTGRGVTGLLKNRITERGSMRCLAAKPVYHADGADLIWLRQHVDAFLETSIS